MTQRTFYLKVTVKEAGQYPDSEIARILKSQLAGRPGYNEGICFYDSQLGEFEVVDAIEVAILGEPAELVRL